MFYSVDGKIVEVGGGFPERRVKTLTFEVEGSHFPRSYYNFNNDTNVINGNELIEIRSSQPNSVTINYGDGTVVVKDFVGVGYYYRIRYNLSDETEVSIIPQHEFTDGFLGRRSVTFEFSFPEYLTYINFQFVLLWGSLPKEFIEFKNLDITAFSYASFLEIVPDSFSKNLTSYRLSNSLINRLTVISDTLFNTKLDLLGVSASYDLSDIISSNLFKINQLSSTLNRLELNSCNIQSLPESFRELINLNFLFLGSNQFTTFPKQVEDLESLIYLNFGTTLNIDNNWWDFTKLTNLKTLFVSAPNTDFSNIVNHLAPLVNLTTFQGAGSVFRVTILNNATYDNLLNGMYELSTVRGFLFPDRPADFPDRFRNFNIGDSNRSYSGVYQQPSGFIQDEANGNPTTPAEKAFVLVNNYGYTITSG